MLYLPLPESSYICHYLRIPLLQGTVDLSKKFSRGEKGDLYTLMHVCEEILFTIDERPHEQHGKVDKRSKLPLDEVCEYADLSAPLDRSILRAGLAAMSSGATWWKSITPDNVYGCSPTARSHKGPTHTSYDCSLQLLILCELRLL